MRKIRANAKDLLIAWAYRYIENFAAIPNEGRSSPLYCSAELEFFQAALEILPDVQKIASEIGEHADFIIKE